VKGLWNKESKRCKLCSGEESIVGILSVFYIHEFLMIILFHFNGRSVRKRRHMREKDMEEEIVSNRWYDLADGFIFS